MQATTISKLLRWTGYGLSVFASVIKVIQHIEAVRPTTQLGYAANLV